MSDAALTRFGCDVPLTLRRDDGSAVDVRVVEIAIGERSGGVAVRLVRVEVPADQDIGPGDLDGAGTDRSVDGSQQLRLRDDLARDAPRNAVAFRRWLEHDDTPAGELDSWQVVAPDDAA